MPQWEHRLRFKEAEGRLSFAPTSLARTTMGTFAGIASVLDAEACTALVATLGRACSTLDDALLTVLIDARKKLSQLAPEVSPEDVFYQGGAVQAIVALPDNQHALIGSDDKTVDLLNVNDGWILRTFSLDSRVFSLALLPDGLRFVSGSADGTARIADHGIAS